MTIDEFITARIEDDEKLARAAITDEGHETWEFGIDPDYRGWGAGGAGVVTDHAGSMLIAGHRSALDNHKQHIARHDPARVLRQCTALRHIVEQYQTVWRWSGWSDGQRETFELNLRSIAAIWSDHPDHQQEWAV